MNLLQEIDNQARVTEFRLFLEELKAIDPSDMGHKLVAECVHAKMEMLKEAGRGDWDAHAGMAQAAGVKGHEADPNVQAKMSGNSRLGLQQQQGPEKGQLVRYQNKNYVIADTDGRVAFINDPSQTFGGQGIKIDNVQELKQIPTKSGKIAWLYVGK